MNVVFSSIRIKSEQDFSIRILFELEKSRRIQALIGREARVLLGFQQFRFTKRGTQSFEGSSRRPESEG